MKRQERLLSIILVFAMLFNFTAFSYADKIEIQEEAKSVEATDQEEEDPGGQGGKEEAEEEDSEEHIEYREEDINNGDGEENLDPVVKLDKKLEEILAKKDPAREELLSHLLGAREELKDLGEIEEAKLEPIIEKLKGVERKLLGLTEEKVDKLLEKLEKMSAQELAEELLEVKEELDILEEIEESDLEDIEGKLGLVEERLRELEEVEDQAGEEESLKKEILDLLETLAKNEEGQEASDEIEAYRKKLDQELDLEELKIIRDRLLILSSKLNKQIEVRKEDSLIKAEKQIVYIVTDKDEASTKEKYKNEFGDVIVTDYIIKIFEEVKYYETKYLTKEEAEGKDLIVILEKDINFRDELLINGTNPDMVSGWDLKVQDNLKRFKLLGKDGQREVPFSFLTQSVKTEVDSVSIEGTLGSGGYGHDTDYTIKNSYIKKIIANIGDRAEHPSKKDSKVNINIENSIIDEITGVHGNKNRVADYTYEFDFNIKDSKVSKFIGAMVLYPDGDFLDIAEKKVKVNHVNITTKDTDFQHFNGIFNSQGAAGMGAEVGDVNINLDNIKVGKIDGMESSHPYNEGYMTAIMDSTNTMADYSFGDINFSMNKYSIEKGFYPFTFTSMNGKEANVNINKIDLKLTDGGDKEMGKADHYIIGFLRREGRKETYPEYEDLIHPINFNVAEGINVELEKVLASSVYLFNSYSERNQTPKNMSINSDVNIKIDDQGPGKGVYYVGLGANTGFNGDIVYNYGGIKASSGNYFDMKARKDAGNRFGECLEENQSGARSLIYNPENVVKGTNALTGKVDTLGIITGFKEIHLSTPLIIFGSNNLKQYAEGMKETKLIPLRPYKVDNNSIVKGEWKLGDQLIILSPMAGKVPKDTFVQGWTDYPPYNLDYFPASGDNIPSLWFLTVNVTLYGNGGKFKNGEYDFYQIHVSDEDKKLEDYLQESDTDNYFELDGNGNIVLDNEGKPIDLKPVHPDGLEFDGWTISKDGSIEEDESKRIDFDEDTVFTKNLNIYAKWKDNNVYELEGQNAEYTVGEEVSEEKLREDIIELATKNDIDAKSEVEIKFLDENKNIDNLTKEVGTYKVELSLGDLTAIVEITVKGKPVEEKFTVDFETNGGSKVESQEIVKGETATKPSDPTRENYEFMGWYRDKALKEEFDFETKLKEDTILYAGWKENKKITVSFETNGGSKLKPQEIYINKTATKPKDPTRENYEFMGWYRDKALKEEFNFETKLKEDTILYAGWKENKKITVSFETNGGSKLEPQEIYINKTATKPKDPTRENYEFMGWYRDKALKEEFDFETKLKEDTILYAGWKENKKIRVSFETNGGSKLEPQEIYINKTATKPENPTKENNKFIGWYKDEGLKEEFNFGTEITEDIILYAKWEEENPVEEKFIVDFETDGGSKVESQAIVKGETATKPSDPTKENHKFVGWYKDKALKEEFNFGTKVTENMILYAKWKKVEEPAEDEFKIIYNANGGEINGEDRLVKEYKKGDKVTKPIDKPSRYGYKFKGWFYEDGNSANFGSGAFRDIELYAKWVRIGSKPEPEDKPDIDGWEEPDRPEEDRPEDKPEPEEDKLNKLDHFAYIKGYPDLNIRPGGNISREEVAVVFYRLLTDRYRASVLTEDNSFKDVDGTRWSNKEISTMANADIIKGYEDGSFRPREEITRAELAAIAARFDKLESSQKNFSDIEGHWAEKYIRSAAEKGWVSGYEDNSFRPNNKMTRAEFVSFVNGVLERSVREENILEGIKDFKDLDKSAWYYEAMIEATHSHTHQEKRLEDGSEIWVEIIEDRKD